MRGLRAVAPSISYRLSRRCLLPAHPCAQGHGRSAVTAAAILMGMGGAKTADESLEKTVKASASCCSRLMAGGGMLLIFMQSVGRWASQGCTARRSGLSRGTIGGLPPHPAGSPRCEAQLPAEGYAARVGRRRSPAQT